MKTLTYTILALLLSANIYAVEIPNQFEDGQVTSASQMNENFQALKAELEAQRALIEANLGNQKVVFQGFSAESMDGGQGLLAMQQACHNLVAGSHVCKDTEIALSPYNSDVHNLEGKAWVLSDMDSSGAGNSAVFSHSPLSLRYYYGNHSDSNMIKSCRGWATNSTTYRGANVSSDLKFQDSLCNSSLKIACCK